jgi:hypothetical protein
VDGSGRAGRGQIGGELVLCDVLCTIAIVPEKNPEVREMTSRMKMCEKKS